MNYRNGRRCDLLRHYGAKRWTPCNRYRFLGGSLYIPESNGVGENEGGELKGIMVQESSRRSCELEKNSNCYSAVQCGACGLRISPIFYRLWTFVALHRFKPFLSLQLQKSYNKRVAMYGCTTIKSHRVIKRATSRGMLLPNGR